MIESAGPTRLWYLWYPGGPGLGQDANWTVCQLCPKNPAKGAEVFPPQCPPQSPWRSWAQPISTILDALHLFQWGNPLSVVWEGRAEWGNDHQSSVDNALQVRSGVWEVLSLSLSHLWRPSSTMAGTAASPPWKGALMSHLHWPKHKHKALLDQHSKDRTWMEDQKEDPTFVRLPHQGYPTHQYGTGWRIRWSNHQPPNWCVHVISIFLHPTQILIMWGCLPRGLATSHCAWWSGYCHLRIQCKSMCPTPMPDTPAILAVMQMTWNCQTLHHSEM